MPSVKKNDNPSDFPLDVTNASSAEMQTVLRVVELFVLVYVIAIQECLLAGVET